MQLTAKVKLQTTPAQRVLLKRTMQLANAACDFLSGLAWESRKFGQFSLHKVGYTQTRAKFTDLASQVVIRCEAKVSQSYAIDRKTRRTFKPTGAIEYDARLLTWYVNKREVSLWAPGGRLRLSFHAGRRQLELLQGRIGQSDLVLINGQFYLFAACTVEEAQPADVSDFLGVDLGLVNLASDSDGEQHSGERVETNRRQFAHRRRNLQKKGTPSAKRKLKKISGQQQRFQKHTNHVISKQLVRKAQDTGRGIALEELGGIRDRATVRRKQRARQANWAFSDLRLKIEYKARRSGVPVVTVDPRDTSRTCSNPECGHVAKASRRSQSEFRCVACGFAANADINAARNIRARATVNWPNECRGMPDIQGIALSAA